MKAYKDWDKMSRKEKEALKKELEHIDRHSKCIPFDRFRCKTSRERAIELVNQAKSEWKLYKRTGEFRHWSNACVSVWQSFQKIMLIKMVNENADPMPIRTASYKLGMKYEYHLCQTLHILAKKGSPVVTEQEVEQDIKEAIRLIENELDLNVFERFAQKHTKALQLIVWVVGALAVLTALYGLLRSLLS